MQFTAVKANCQISFAGKRERDLLPVSESNSVADHCQNHGSNYNQGLSFHDFLTTVLAE
jgi:hypothetical protein